ncbi:hypothetical protein [Roseivirga sp.]|uniref:hypothetical protein n=1 Tax=Roseivirga sp. TaxID=1964215 RepID=UPI003B8A9C5A
MKLDDNIFEHFEKFIKLSDELKAALDERLKPVIFEKGEMVLSADRVCTESYFIKKGILRTYFLKDGKEVRI